MNSGGVIVRTERRQRWSDEEKAAIVAESLREGVTARSVAKRHGISESLIYNWRANRREAETIASQALKFIPCGQFVDASANAAVPEVITEKRVSAAPHASRGNVSPSAPEQSPPGSIGIELANGVRLSVDSFVNEKALARVLRTLKVVSC